MFDALATRENGTRYASIAVVIALAVVLGLGLGVSMTIGAAAIQESDTEPSEDEYVAPVPEPGDEYFEAAAEDGRWVSYVNPRDEYRSPYLGDGSGKLCVTLLNEDGEVISGETVPNTTVTIPTGDSIAWHTGADPMTVRFPLTDHYERPLDSDQFGTSSALPQGDGLLDSHCIEFHGPAETETIEYGEAQVQGEHADRIEVVGYIQKANDTWDTDVDPIEDAESYEEAGGGWTYRPNASHGQAVAVLQLTPDDAGENGNESIGTGSTAEAADDDSDENGSNAADDEKDDGTNPMPGLGVATAAVAIAAALVIARRVER